MTEMANSSIRDLNSLISSRVKGPYILRSNCAKLIKLTV